MLEHGTVGKPGAIDKAARGNQPPNSLVGQQVGSYRVEKVLGSGGFGTVYLAVHDAIGKQAAIKVLDPAVLLRDPTMATRLRNEARAVNLIKHPGIVNIFEFGQLPDGTAFIAMDFLDGVSLETRLQRPIAVADALRLCREIALALRHAQGTVSLLLECARMTPESVAARRKVLGAVRPSWGATSMGRQSTGRCATPRGGPWSRL